MFYIMYIIFSYKGLFVCHGELDESIQMYYTFVRLTPSGIPLWGTSKQYDKSPLGDLEAFLIIDNLQYNCYPIYILLFKINVFRRRYPRLPQHRPHHPI